MTNYKEAGVDIELLKSCSKVAKEASNQTYSLRADLIGKPRDNSGLLDFGDFYLSQNTVGIGTKMMIAEKMNKFDTLGYDLAAMVADKIIEKGAEVVSLSHNIDTNKVDKKKIKEMIDGLNQACSEQKIIIANCEIAELGEMSNGIIWNASAIGIVERSKIIDGKNIKEGDKIIGLKSSGFHSNGFTLIRHILKDIYGENWIEQKFNEKKTWGEITLIPSVIYSDAILEMTGRFKKERNIEIKGIAHVNCGGIPESLNNILKKTGLGANINNLPETPDFMIALQDLHTVRDDESYKTWNMGIGMILVSNEFEKIEKICQKKNVTAQIIGEITNNPGIELTSQGCFEKRKKIKF